MKYESYIAKRFFTGSVNNQRLSRAVLYIAITGVALSVLVMIVSICIVTGFKNEITRKVVGFGSHIRLKNFDNNQSYEESPVSIREPFLNTLRADSRIEKITAFASKAGIIKTSEDIQGVVIKGLDSLYKADFFADKMMQGSFDLSIRDGQYPAIISKNIADKMNLKLNDPLVVYFIEQPPRIRKFIIKGIYSTGLEEFDNMYVFSPLSVIQKLNNWTADEAGGIEITLKHLSDLSSVNQKVYELSGFQYNTMTIKELYPDIFHWLDLQDVNVIIILVLMILVAGINMISTLLIIILENTATIGLLKALGARNAGIRKIFIYVSSGIVLTGLIAGNLIALTLCYLQYHFHLISLPQESYYVSYVPINFSPLNILLINIGTLTACVLVMIIPSVIITKINPVKSLRYE